MLSTLNSNLTENNIEVLPLNLFKTTYDISSNGFLPDSCAKIPHQFKFIEILTIDLQESDPKVFREMTNTFIKIHPYNEIKYSLEGLSDKVTYRTPLHHQVKEIYIVPKRNDISQRNQWLNFTNLDDDTEIQI